MLQVLYWLEKSALAFLDFARGLACAVGFGKSDERSPTITFGQCVLGLTHTFETQKVEFNKKLIGWRSLRGGDPVENSRGSMANGISACAQRLCLYT